MEDYNTFTCASLKSILRERGLKLCGKKCELIDRIIADNRAHLILIAPNVPEIIPMEHVNNTYCVYISYNDNMLQLPCECTITLCMLEQLMQTELNIPSCYLVIDDKFISRYYGLYTLAELGINNEAIIVATRK